MEKIVCIVILILYGVVMLLMCYIAIFQKEKKPKNKEKKSKNNVHFYVARDKSGDLWLYIGKPNRSLYSFANPLGSLFTFPYNTFDCFGLNEKDYANLKWEDEPVEFFINMED